MTSFLETTNFGLQSPFMIEKGKLQILELKKATPLRLFELKTPPQKATYILLADFDGRVKKDKLELHVNIQYFIHDTINRLFVKKGKFPLEYWVFAGEERNIKSRELYSALEAAADIIDAYLYLRYRDVYGIGHSFRVDYPSYDKVRDQLTYWAGWFNERLKEN